MQNKGITNISIHNLNILIIDPIHSIAMISHIVIVTQQQSDQTLQASHEHILQKLSRDFCDRMKILLLNIAWFGAAGITFTQDAALFVASHATGVHRGNKDLQKPTIYAVKFLGGINQGFAVLNVLHAMIEFNRKRPSPDQWTIFAASFVAHLSQWWFNVKYFVQTQIRGKTEGVPVRFSRELLFIFVIDLCMALLNLRKAYIMWRRSQEDEFVMKE